MSTTIGSIIAELRKSKGATQDELGSAVGVSAQAVSKWETGGTPDIELLPAIADFFGVSIDSLFGRDMAAKLDVGGVIAGHIANIERGERFNAAYRCAWAVALGLCGEETVEDSLDKYIENETYSQVLSDSGIELMHLSKKTPYFFLAPETEDGWKLLAAEPEKLTMLFTELGKRDVTDALLLLCARDGRAFTGELLVKRLGVTSERAEELITLFTNYKLINQNELELNDGSVKISSFSPNPAVIPLLIFAGELIDRPRSFNYFCGGRSKPYLKA